MLKRHYKGFRPCYEIIGAIGSFAWPRSIRAMRKHLRRALEIGGDVEVYHWNRYGRRKQIFVTHKPLDVEKLPMSDYTKTELAKRKVSTFIVINSEAAQRMADTAYDRLLNGDQDGTIAYTI